MRFYVMILLLSLSCVCLTLAQVSYEDCCLKYVTKISERHAVGYRLQRTDGGCNIPAVIFIMRKGRVFCTNGKEQWVQKLMDKINQRIGNGKRPGRRPHRPRQNRG
ncbi:C-C motif chemokine 20 [Hippoglossus hippoglossus]|uniref:C-C motif chemokine 20 n=1 Tax=Hippoglossus hippoglossus TaxID=8267 RepID=UPI00148C6CBE|nr:C-C motif chemokine 20 [Hippoglossus hippoglossus]